MSTNRRYAETSVRRRRQEMTTSDEPVLLALHGALGFFTDEEEKQAIHELLHLVRNGYPHGPEAVFTWEQLGAHIWTVMLRFHRASMDPERLTDARAYGMAALVESAWLARAEAARQQPAKVEQPRARRRTTTSHMGRDVES